MFADQCVLRIVMTAVVVVITLRFSLSADESAGPLKAEPQNVSERSRLTLYRNTKGDVEGISYSGSGDWLINSQDRLSRWEDFQHLKVIALEATEITVPMIEYVASLKTVRSLVIWECVLPGDTLAPLVGMKNLDALELANNGFAGSKVSPEHWRFLLELKALRSLDLHDLDLQKAELTFPSPCRVEHLNLSAVSEGTARNLRTWTTLQFGSFSSIQAPSVLLESLRHHRNLKTLSLDLVDLHLSDFTNLAELRELRYLRLPVRSLRSVDFLSGMNELEEMTLSYDTAEELLENHDRKPLKRIKKLNVVTKDTHGVAAIRHVFQSPTLEALSCVANVLRPESFESLRNHPSLKEVRLSAVLKPEDLPILASMPKLEVLVIMNPRETRWFRDAVAALPKVRIVSAAKKSEGGDGATLHIGDQLPSHSYK
jgi:hypothetical protein